MIGYAYTGLNGSANPPRIVCVPRTSEMKFASRREYYGYIFLSFCVLGEEGAEMKKGERTKSGKRRGGDSYFLIYTVWKWMGTEHRTEWKR